MKTIRVLWLSFLTHLLAGQFCGAQEVILETAKVGPTNQINTGIIIAPTQFIGVRFHFEHDATITSVGGHVADLFDPFEPFPIGSSFHTVIVRLGNQAALPTGSPFAPEEVVASAVCTPSGYLSRDYTFPVMADLPAGHYALMFAGIGTAVMPGNDKAKGNEPYIVWNGRSWENYPRSAHSGPKLPDYRFTLYGFSQE